MMCKCVCARLFLPTTLLLLAALMSCAPDLSREDGDYLHAVRAQPLEFEVAAARADSVWERGRRFFTLYTLARLDLDSPAALESAPPVQGDDRSFGYRILREDAGDMVRFSVECYTLELRAQDDARLNGGILAYYMRSGKIRDQFLLGRAR